MKVIANWIGLSPRTWSVFNSVTPCCLRSRSKSPILACSLRANPLTRDIRLVALSADALPEQIDAALKDGFRDYLTKPIEFARLLSLFDEHLQPA